MAGSSENKAHLAQLGLELGLSLAILCLLYIAPGFGSKLGKAFQKDYYWFGANECTLGL